MELSNFENFSKQGSLQYCFENLTSGEKTSTILPNSRICENLESAVTTFFSKVSKFPMAGLYIFVIDCRFCKKNEFVCGRFMPGGDFTIEIFSALFLTLSWTGSGIPL